MDMIHLQEFIKKVQICNHIYLSFHGLTKKGTKDFIPAES